MRFNAVVTNNLLVRNPQCYIQFVYLNIYSLTSSPSYQFEAQTSICRELSSALSRYLTLALPLCLLPLTSLIYSNFDCVVFFIGVNTLRKIMKLTNSKDVIISGYSLYVTCTNTLVEMYRCCYYRYSDSNFFTARSKLIVYNAKRYYSAQGDTS